MQARTCQDEPMGSRSCSSQARKNAKEWKLSGEEKTKEEWAFLQEWKKKIPIMTTPMRRLPMVLKDDLEELLNIVAWGLGRSCGRTPSSWKTMTRSMTLSIPPSIFNHT
jgi:hypothetical protein